MTEYLNFKSNNGDSDTLLGVNLLVNSGADAGGAMDDDTASVVSGMTKVTAVTGVSAIAAPIYQ